MLSTPTCLHIPPLYEEGQAKIIWEGVENASGYELDLHFDETFDTALKGLSWADIYDYQPRWDDIDTNSWSQLEALPAQGLSWQNVEFAAEDWDEIEAKSFSWADITRHPVDFRIFKGEGIKTPAPDQGLSWADIYNHSLDWEDSEGKQYSWDDFELIPSRGRSWGQHDGLHLDWSAIETEYPSWFALQNQLPIGLCWSSIDGRFISWNEFETNSLSWDEFETLPPDDKTHRSHIVDIPLYTKQSNFRVRGYNEGEFSDYLTSTLLKHRPRSLAKYTVPCLHIPTLNEGEDAELVWGDLYGAQGYILERKYRDKFAKIYDGEGTLTIHPSDCEVWREQWYQPDCKKHLKFADNIAIGEKTATYRIKGYNSTDSSKALTTKEFAIIPIFYRDDATSLSLIKDNIYYIQLNAHDIETFRDIALTLEYQQAHIEIVFCSLNQSDLFPTSTIADITTKIISQTEGQIKFVSSKKSGGEIKSSGLVALFGFKAKQTCQTTLRLY